MWKTALLFVGVTMLVAPSAVADRAPPPEDVEMRAKLREKVAQLEAKELAKHQRRLKRIDDVEAKAKAHKDADKLTARIAMLRKKENARHARRMGKIAKKADKRLDKLEKRDARKEKRKEKKAKAVGKAKAKAKMKAKKKAKKKAKAKDKKGGW